jgi:Leucine-rich repeat (LRR) protein
VALDLSHNKLTKLPDAIRHSANLQILNLSYNDLTKLPDALGHLEDLKHLNIEGNPFPKETFPAIARQIADLTYLETLETEYTKEGELLDQVVLEKKYGRALFTIWKQLRTVASLPDLFKPSHLRTALTGNNPVFEQLIVLSLKNHGLEELPAELSCFCNLEVLDLSSNRFTDLPDAVLTLKRLQKIDLSKNLFEPAIFYSILQRLKTLPQLKKVYYGDITYTFRNGELSTGCCVIL